MANTGQGTEILGTLQVNGSLSGATNIVATAGTTGTRTQTLQDASGTIALLSGPESWTGTQDFTGATMLVKDNASFQVKGTADATKIMEFNVGGFTTGNTRIFSFPDATDTVAVLGTAQTFTATKTFTVATIFAAGTATAPGINFTDAGTGLYRPALNQLGFTINGSSVSTVSSTLWTMVIPLSIGNTTASTSSTTGALVVSGGVGVAGQVSVAGAGGTCLLLSNNTFVNYNDSGSTARRVLGLSAVNDFYFGIIDTGWGGATHIQSGTTLDIKVNGASGTWTNALTFATNGDATFVGMAITAGRVRAIVTKTTTYTVTANDEIVIGDATGGAFTITLPAAPVAGEIHTFLKKDSTGNLITISGNGKNINGAATYTGLNVQYNKVNVVFDGTVWFITG